MAATPTAEFCCGKDSKLFIEGMSWQSGTVASSAEGCRHRSGKAARNIASNRTLSDKWATVQRRPSKPRPLLQTMARSGIEFAARHARCHASAFRRDIDKRGVQPPISQSNAIICTFRASMF
jgi:hypothetical protein